MRLSGKAMKAEHSTTQGGEPLSQRELHRLVQLLKKLTPGFLPQPIFLEFARLVTLPIVEIVPVRQRASRTEVLLTRRDSDDPIWPDRLHVPGTVIRSTDRSYDDSIHRLLEIELDGTPSGPPHFVVNLLHHQDRGSESALIFWVEVLGEPRAGNFYDSGNLPRNWSGGVSGG